MNKNFFAGLFIGLGLLAIVAFRPSAEKPAEEFQKWEYLRLLGPMNHVPDVKMNEAGQQGWELVAIEGASATFKRPLK